MALGKGFGGRQAWFELVPPAARSWANSFLSLSLHFITKKMGVVIQRMIYTKQRLVRRSLVPWINDAQHCGQLRYAFSTKASSQKPSWGLHSMLQVCRLTTETELDKGHPKGSFLAFRGANFNLVFNSFAINMSDKTKRFQGTISKLLESICMRVVTSEIFLN